jgi:hypothetical protein
MEIFIVIVLVLIVFALWSISSGIRNIQNTLFSIDSNLEHLKDFVEDPNPYKYK